MAADALTAIADELYALVPSRFTAARNARAKALRPTDPELAGLVAALRKPSASAGLVNRLARSAPGAISELAALGERMRAAQDARDAHALTELGGERRRTVADAVHLAAALAEREGETASSAQLDEVAQTLTAVTAGAGPAAAVASGRLMRPLELVGFGQVDLDGAVAGQSPAPDAGGGIREPVSLAERRRAKTAGKQRDAGAGKELDAGAGKERERAERERAERARAEREQAEREGAERERAERRRVAEKRQAELDDRAREAAEELSEAEAAVDALDHRQEQLDSEIERLEDRRRQVEDELRGIRRDRRAAVAERDAAARDADRAARAARDARSALH